MLALADSEVKTSLISLSISKSLSLNLSKELSTLSNLELKLVNSYSKEEICGTTEKFDEEAENKLDWGG